MTTLHFKSAQVQNDYPTDDVIETIPVQLDPADLRNEIQPMFEAVSDECHRHFGRLKLS